MEPFRVERSNSRRMQPTFRIAMAPDRCCALPGHAGRSSSSYLADADYQGPRVAAASPIRVQILRKLEGQIGFAVHARRWVVV